jgi:hypothetical protein
MRKYKYLFTHLRHRAERILVTIKPEPPMRCKKPDNLKSEAVPICCRLYAMP